MARQRGAVWLAASSGSAGWSTTALAAPTGLAVPFHEMGAFNPCLAVPLVRGAVAWARGATRPMRGRFAFRPGWWRSRWRSALGRLGGATTDQGQAPFGGDEELNLLFDKWQLGPLRIVNLVVLHRARDALRAGAHAAHAAPALARGHGLGLAAGVLRAPGGGAAGAGLLGAARPRGPGGAIALLAVVFAALYAVARASGGSTGERQPGYAAARGAPSSVRRRPQPDAAPMTDCQSA